MNDKIQLDYHKLAYHPIQVSKWLNDEKFAPIYIEIGPVDACNHQCIFCALDYLKGKVHEINIAVMMRAVENMAEYGVKAIMFAGEGEPLLYRKLPEIIQRTKDCGIDVAITTNGVLFNQQKADLILPNLSWIKISIDAGNRVTYAKIHGTRKNDFDNVLINLEYASNLRNRNDLDVTIGTQMLVLEQNFSEIEQLTEQVKNIGVDYLVLKPYSQHPESINKTFFSLREHEAYLDDLVTKYSDDHFNLIYRSNTAKEIEFGNISYDHCYGIYFFALIDACGNVIPCNLFYGKQKYCYGNLNSQSFKDIWEGEKRTQVLSNLFSKGCTDCRQGCRLNFINKYLDDLKEGNIKHKNFI